MNEGIRIRIFESFKDGVAFNMGKGKTFSPWESQFKPLD